MYIIIPVTSSQLPQEVLKPCHAKLPTPTATQEIAYIIKNQLRVEREGDSPIGSSLASHRMYKPTNTKAKLESVFTGSRIQLSLVASQKPESVVSVQTHPFSAYIKMKITKKAITPANTEKNSFLSWNCLLSIKLSLSS